MAQRQAGRDIDDLPKNAANYTALTPLWFLERAALVHPTRVSVVHGSRRYTWRETYQRCRRLASAISNHSIGLACTVAVIAPNVPVMYEAHFGVPMAGAVVNAVNIRLNAATIAFLLNHSSASAVLVDQEFFVLAEEALKIMAEKNKSYKRPLLIVVGDETCDPNALKYALRKGAIDYEKFLETGDPDFAWKPPEDEWQSIALGYTSGTTSSPKGVVLHHRGAYLMSLGNPVIWGMNEGAVYLWTLPMFHCNGWCFTWTLAAVCGTSICLRQVTAKAVYSAIANHGVTHFCAAPVVLNTIVNAPAEETILPLPHVVHVMTAGAAPPPSVLLGMSQKGFRVTHTYGLSETYGPSTLCAWKPEWDSLAPETQARLNARQGVRYVCLEGLDVVNPKTMEPVPADGTTAGEIVFRGNVVMKGYLKNPKANEEAFANGWYHSGDIAVKNPDGYIEIKDRSKDIIISGGENISSLEVENTLYHHPAILPSNGNVLRSEILGAIKMKCYLSGMPELRLGLNDKVMFETTGRATRGKAIEMEDVKFHQCVRLSRFENDRTISFIPPDGEFELMSYRLNTQVKPLIWVECIVESHSGSRIEYMLKAKAQFKRRSTANNVEITVPVPEDADSPRFRTNIGNVHYAPEKSAIVWKIKQFGGGKEFLMRAELGLPSVKGDDDHGGGMTGGFGGSMGGVGGKGAKRPISVKFEIPYFTTSGIQVRYLKIIEPKLQYPSLPWVRYITQAGDITVRLPEVN